MTKKNKRIMRMILLCSLIVLLSSFANAPKAINTLSSWDAYIVEDDADQGYYTKVAFWSSSPKVWYDKIDESYNFAFLSGLLNGQTEWNAALGTSISVSASYTNAEIEYYGGTIDDINDLHVFCPIASGSNITGYTNYPQTGNHQWKCDYLYQESGETYYINCYEQLSIRGYIISANRTYNQYLKTCTHELGHAMGWRGHASVLNNTWVMWQGSSETTTLCATEKAHLSQIYEDQNDD